MGKQRTLPLDVGYYAALRRRHSRVGDITTSSVRYMYELRWMACVPTLAFSLAFTGTRIIGGLLTRSLYSCVIRMDTRFKLVENWRKLFYVRRRVLNVVP